MQSIVSLNFTGCKEHERQALLKIKEDLIDNFGFFLLGAPIKIVVLGVGFGVAIK